MPFDGKRMFWGGFEPIVDTAETRGRRQRLTLDRPKEKETTMSEVTTRPCGQRATMRHPLTASSSGTS